MQHTPTPPKLRIKQISPTCCTPAFLLTPPLIMYVMKVNIFLFVIIDMGVYFHQKPIVCLLLLPPTQPRQAVAPTLPPMIQLPSNYKPRPDPYAVIKRYTGRALDRLIGALWCLLALVGAGSSIIGLFNFFVGLGAWVWWKNNRAGGDVQV